MKNKKTSKSVKDKKTKSTKNSVKAKNIKKPFKLPPYTVKKVISTLSQTQDWGIKQGNLPETWKITRGENTVVMVLDTGYTNHIDLQGGMVPDACISTEGGDKVDRQYHSTHCCGIIGARDNNLGVVGVAPECQIITVKVLGDDGSGSFEAIIKGLEYAAQLRPDVVSMSLGASQGSEELHKAIKKLYDLNIPCICAAGNDGNDSPVNYPAKYPECIAVAAYDKNQNIANFSCGGAEVFISAPGVDIYSTYGNNTYAKLSGTSMATPFISGIVALLISKHKKQEKETGKNDCKTVEDIKNHLKKYAYDKGDIGHDYNWGWGVLDPIKLIGELNVGEPISEPDSHIKKPSKSFWSVLGALWKSIWS